MFENLDNFLYMHGQEKSCSALWLVSCFVVRKRGFSLYLFKKKRFFSIFVQEKEVFLYICSRKMCGKEVFLYICSRKNHAAHFQFFFVRKSEGLRTMFILDWEKSCYTYICIYTLVGAKIQFSLLDQKKIMLATLYVFFFKLAHSLLESLKKNDAE